MTDDIPDLIRTAFADIAEEAQPVDLTSQALRGARRRSLKITIAAAGAVLAMGVATPFALASGGNPARPANPTPAAMPSVPTSPTPAATPSVPTSPTQAQSHPAGSGIAVTPCPTQANTAYRGIAVTPCPGQTH